MPPLNRPAQQWGNTHEFVPAELRLRKGADLVLEAVQWAIQDFYSTMIDYGLRPDMSTLQVFHTPPGGDHADPLHESELVGWKVGAWPKAETLVEGAAWGRR